MLEAVVQPRPEGIRTYPSRNEVVVGDSETRSRIDAESSRGRCLVTLT